MGKRPLFRQKTLKIQSMESSNRRSAPRFFVPEPMSVGARLDLGERASRHITVLRLREGDSITLFNGDGGEHAAVLTLISRGRCAARITGRFDVDRESPLDITLAQCLSSSDRMDITLQKATELGVLTIQPLESERSVVRLSGDRVEKRMTHWRNIVFAACEQCGRNLPPTVGTLDRLQAWLIACPPKSAAELRLLLLPDATTGLASLALSKKITLLVGPEGGLAPHEQGAALNAGFTPIRLGPRTLRTETAPLAAVAALQTLWGDLG